MPWRETVRDDYRRESGRHASDMTDREWALIGPFLPPARRHGRPRTTDLREVVNAVLYIAVGLEVPGSLINLREVVNAVLYIATSGCQ